MVKYFLLIFMCLMTSCKDDEQIMLTLEEECFGYNMVDTWSVIDSITTVLVSLDSTKTDIYNDEFFFYENGTGKTYKDFLNSDVFFSWNIQCHPDILTINFPFDYDDSIVSFFDLHNTLVYEILINEIDYKKMKLERTDSIDQTERKRVVIRDMTRK